MSRMWTFQWGAAAVVLVAQVEEPPEVLLGGLGRRAGGAATRALARRSTAGTYLPTLRVFGCAFPASLTNQQHHPHPSPCTLARALQHWTAPLSPRRPPADHPTGTNVMTRYS